MKNTRNIRPLVFWPPFLLLIAAVIMSFANLEAFLDVTSTLNSWVLEHFSWLFSIGTLTMVVTCIWVFFSPLGKVRIGGEHATPLISRWRWFSIALCTTVAIGILFWATAEPMYHLHSPPTSMGLEPGSADAAKFAMSTLFLHWSLTPYAIYTIPALMFALAHYNLGKPFSLGSALSPLFGDRMLSKPGQLIDALALYALVAGMAASLGTGVLTLAGGLDNVFSVGTGPLVLGIITLLIVVTFILSAASGLKKGIAMLSSLNTRIFFLIFGFVFLFGPTTWILSIGIEGLGVYLGNFVEKSLFTGAASGDEWPKSWTIFYWANWLAWAPVTALFLGKISRGYTVREFLVINMLLPALFACAWMSVFGGTALSMDMNSDGMLNKALEATGPESIVYVLLDNLPLAGITVAVFIFVSFLSYVTAADSNTEAMSSLCQEDNEASLSNTTETYDSGKFTLKLIWGCTIGFVAWIMTSFAGIEGIKMMSNLGGLPALFIVLGCNAALIRCLLSGRFNTHGVGQRAEAIAV